MGGVQLGNVWIGVQPALGLEGDPMRLLFERDLTPHPQYAGASAMTVPLRCVAVNDAAQSTVSHHSIPSLQRHVRI